MRSAELAQYLDSHMVPAINQTRSSSTEADATSSERGICMYTISVNIEVIAHTWSLNVVVFLWSTW